MTADSCLADSTIQRAMESMKTLPPRKIHLDCATYCRHSVRASAGNADCDHDFEPAPTVRQPNYAVWNCTRCGRAFRYEIWSSGPASAPGKATRPRR
jgi:hypothetical protein